MREIKFRAWYASEKRMLEWDELKDDWPETLPILENTLSDVSPAMQYIGLKDKNGVEIYEGDILVGIRELKDARVAVEWHDEECYYMLFGAWWTTKKLTRKNVKEAEVIGNIHENPELLGVAE